MNTVHVAVKSPYDVIIGYGLLTQAGEYIKATKAGKKAAKAVIITDDIVDPLYAVTLAKSLHDTGFLIYKYILNNGEASKCSNEYVSILNYLTEKQVTRTDLIIALGGGVIGDLAGFAAATYLRGIPFIQIPTTLLAAVDSSVGGKTAINLDCGKNLAGAFYQPSLVLCDYKALDTLPQPILSDGCAEVIKYGMIKDAMILKWMKEGLLQNIAQIITRCVKIKAAIVLEDEFDRGQRQLLNFGHTIGHAIEACSHYSISHGSAVSIGMAMITRAACKLGFCKDSCLSELESALMQYQLPLTCTFTKNQLLKAMRSDKKRTNDQITLVLPNDIGSAFLHKTKLSGLEAFLDNADKPL